MWLPLDSTLVRPMASTSAPSPHGTSSPAVSAPSEPQRSDAVGGSSDAERIQQRRELLQAADVCRRAAAGDLEARIVGIRGDGEEAQLYRSINHLLDMTDAFLREAGAALEHASREQFYRRVLEQGMQGGFGRSASLINQAMQQMSERSTELKAMRRQQRELADSFELSVKGVAESIATSANQLEASAKALTRAAEVAERDADATSASARLTSDNTEVVARTSEAMKAALSDIGRQITEASRVSREAVQGVRATDATIADLQASTGAIGSVVRVISGVASQTKLLALNAGIEAARAGEAGRGFGVVANEVKSLAGQTSEATKKVEDQILSVQAGTRRAVEATQLVREQVATLDGIAEALASAMERQREATQEIVSSTHLTASAAHEAADRATAIRSSAAETRTAGFEVLAASSELATLSTQLLDAMGRFLRAFRT